MCRANCSRWAGVNLVHVPYRGGGPAVTDLLGGQVQVMFAPTPPSIEHIRSGKLRASAVTTAVRSEAFPDVPSIDDFVPSYEASAKRRAIKWSSDNAPGPRASSNRKHVAHTP